MLCCLIAAMIIAHVTAIVRGWLVFFGLVRPQPGEDADTLYRRIREWLRRPRVRKWVAVAVSLELAAGGGWVGVAHGQHLYRIGDKALGVMRGEQVHYVGYCDRSGGSRSVRLVIDQHGHVTATPV